MGIEQCDMHIAGNINVVEILQKKNINKWGRRILYYWSVIIEPFRILRINKKTRVSVIHVSSGHFFDLVLYRLLSIAINAKLIYQLVEFRSSYRNESLYHKINGILLARYGPTLGHGVICISDFLMEHAKVKNPCAELIKIPPITKFNTKKKTVENKNSFLLFCGNSDDKELVNIVVNSYKNSKISRIVYLILVLRGDDIEVNQWTNKYPKIQIMKNLEYNVLIQMYADAMGLFIPMRDNIRDIARFPNKICEYTAAKGIIITTNHGEIPNYFEDNVNAIIANDFSVESIASKLDWLCDNYQNLDFMRDNAFKLGQKHFDISNYHNEMKCFLDKLF
jgi:glycosyltransferase involved in cell wall biosynthesis